MLYVLIVPAESAQVDTTVHGKYRQGQARAQAQQVLHRKPVPRVPPKAVARLGHLASAGEGGTLLIAVNY